MTTGYGSGMCMGFVTHAHLTGPKKIKKLVRECRYLTSRLTPYLVRVPTRPNFKKKEKTFLDGGGGLKRLVRVRLKREYLLKYSCKYPYLFIYLFSSIRVTRVPTSYG